MNPYPSILDALGRGHPVRMVGAGGGCIADSNIAEFADGSRVFVKCLEGVPGLFEGEATGLRTLASADVIRVPGVLAVGEGALVLEYIKSASKPHDFYESFGRNLARLHSVAGPCSGFPHDNYIGTTVQCNAPAAGISVDFTSQDLRAGDGSDWTDFFLERRLRFQVKLAVENGHGTALQKLLDQGERQIRDLLDEAVNFPCLLHGDLWAGNFMVDEKGEACLIDPAVYYGHRESDLAMTELFGGFDAGFYGAYNEQLPTKQGYEQRRPIYQLYHLLNHLNLFGATYYSQCQRILSSYSPSGS